MTQAGYYLCYVMQVDQAKHEMKEKSKSLLPDASLEQIVLEDNQAEISWEEKNKEFYFHNKLYDVVKTRIVNGKTYLFCINDHKEMALLKHWQKGLRSSGDSKDGKTSLKFQFPVYTLNTIPVSDKEMVRTHEFESLTQASLHSAVLDVSAPPPKA